LIVFLKKIMLEICMELKYHLTVSEAFQLWGPHKTKSRDFVKLTLFYSWMLLEEKPLKFCKVEFLISCPFRTLRSPRKKEEWHWLRLSLLYPVQLSILLVSSNSILRTLVASLGLKILWFSSITILCKGFWRSLWLL
jgi:hypothetical protein